MSCGVGCRYGSHLALLWLWRRLATAPIRPLASEPPYATAVALKIQKDKKKKKATKYFFVVFDFWFGIFFAFVFVLFCFCCAHSEWNLEFPGQGMEPVPEHGQSLIPNPLGHQGTLPPPLPLLPLTSSSLSLSLSSSSFFFFAFEKDLVFRTVVLEKKKKKKKEGGKMTLLPCTHVLTFWHVILLRCFQMAEYLMGYTDLSFLKIGSRTV